MLTECGGVTHRIMVEDTVSIVPPMTPSNTHLFSIESKPKPMISTVLPPRGMPLLGFRSSTTAIFESNVKLPPLTICPANAGNSSSISCAVATLSSTAPSSPIGVVHWISFAVMNVASAYTPPNTHDMTSALLKPAPVTVMTSPPYILAAVGNTEVT